MDEYRLTEISDIVRDNLSEGFINVLEHEEDIKLDVLKSSISLGLYEGYADVIIVYRNETIVLVDIYFKENPSYKLYKNKKAIKRSNEKWRWIFEKIQYFSKNKEDGTLDDDITTYVGMIIPDHYPRRVKEIYKTKVIITWKNDYIDEIVIFPDSESINPKELKRKEKEDE